MKHEFPIQKKDHTINQWLILCSLYALEYASENILDDPNVKFGTRNKFNTIKSFARNTINNSFNNLKDKPITVTEVEYIVYDHVVMMQKLFMCATAIPEDKLTYFLDTVTELSSNIVFEKISETQK